MDKSKADQPLDDFFRRKLENATVTPSADGWNRLQAKMQGEQRPAEKTKVNRMGPLWYWSAAAACVLIVLLLTRLGTDKQPDLQLASKVKSAQPKPVEVLDDKGGSSVTLPQFEAVAKNEPPVRRAEATINKLQNVTAPKAAMVRSDQPATHTLAVVEKPAPKVEEGRMLQTGEKDERLANSNQNESTQPLRTKTLETERTLIVSVAEPVFSASLTDVPVVETSSGQGMGSRKIGRMFQQIRRLKNGEGIARVNPDIEYDDESGLLDRLVRTARNKDNHSKSQKQ